MIDEINERAYFLWQEAGCPDGHSDEFWLRAEKELKTETESETITRRSLLKRLVDFVENRSWLTPFA